MIGMINHVDASVLAGFKTIHLKMKPTVRCSGQYFIYLFPLCSSWKMPLLVWPWVIAGAPGLAVRKIMWCLSLAFIYLKRSYSVRIDGVSGTTNSQLILLTLVTYLHGTMPSLWLWGLYNTEINHSYFSFPHLEDFSISAIWLFPFFIKLGSFEVCFKVYVFFGHLFSFFLSLIWYGILLNSTRGGRGSPKRQEVRSPPPI